MSRSATSLWSILALLSAVIVAMPASAQTRSRTVARTRVGPIVHSSVSTSYRIRTVPRVRNVNRVRNVTRTRTRVLTRTAFRNIRQVKYHDITIRHYIRHTHRIVTVTRIQPIVRVHTVTRVHHVVLTRLRTRVVPRVRVTVVPRLHTRTVMLNNVVQVAQTRVMPTRYAMGSSRTVSMGTRMARISGGPIYNVVGRRAARRVLKSRY